MTRAEAVAFNAGIAHAAEMARIAAITIEIRDDAGHIRQQAAAAALHGLAEGLIQAAKGAAEISGARAPLPVAPREVAIAQGFTGDTCDVCGSTEMKRGAPA